jgi:hypothetical protein
MTGDIGLQATELARLIIAVLVLPGIVFFGRRLRSPAGGGYYMLSVIAVYASYVFTVLEEFWYPDLINTAQHLALAVAGILALVATLKTRREVTGGGG